MIIKKGGFDSPLTNTNAKNQSANAGAVSDATYPEIFHTVADTPGAVDITIVGMSATVYYISGNATTATVPAFS